MDDQEAQAQQNVDDAEAKLEQEQNDLAEVQRLKEEAEQRAEDLNNN